MPGATPSTMTLDTRGPGWFLVNGNHADAEQLHARRLRQQPGHAERAVALVPGRAAEPGRHRAVQGADQQLLRGVRPLGRRGRERVDQVGHQRRPRLVVVLQPRRVARRDVVEREHQRPRRRTISSGTRPARTVRRADPAEQAVLLRLVRRLPPQLLAVGHRLGADRRRAQRRVLGAHHRSADAAAVPEQHDSARSLGSARREDPRRLRRSRTVRAASRRRASSPTTTPIRRRRVEKTHKVDFRSDLVADANNRFFVRYSLLQQRIFREQILDGHRRSQQQPGRAVQPQSQPRRELEPRDRLAHGERAAPRLHQHRRALRARHGERA